MAKGEYNVSDNKESENGNAIQDRVETVNPNNNEDGYVGYGFKKDESVNINFNLPLIGISFHTQCLKIPKKVSFYNFASEASYVYFLSGYI